MEKISMNLV